jgi:hypothetical protein
LGFSIVLVDRMFVIDPHLPLLSVGCWSHPELQCLAHR